MLVSDEMRPSISWFLTPGAGSTWVASDTTQLTNGKPRNGCRFTRLSGSLGVFVDSGFLFNVTPRVIALLGLSENLDGVSCSLVGNEAGGPVQWSIAYGSYTPTRLADGSLAIIVVLEGPQLETSGFRFSFATSDAAFTVGEVVFADAAEWTIRRQWLEAVQFQGVQNVTVTGQPFNVRRIQRRSASVTICPQTWERGYTATDVQTMQALQSRLSRSQPVLVIPALRPPGLGASAPIDPEIVTRTALFGYASEIGAIESVDNSTLLQMRLTFTEAPAGRIEG